MLLHCATVLSYTSLIFISNRHNLISAVISWNSNDKYLQGCDLFVFEIIFI